MSRPFLVGVVLAVVSLAYVLYPLLAPRRRQPAALPGNAPLPRAPTDEEIEAAIRSYRETHVAGRSVCPVCGPRPEPDAIFCSTCGRRLEGAGAA